MVAYSIVIIPLIKRLKLTYPDVTQPWYADNDGALDTFENLERYFNILKCNGPAWGYYPDPTKIIMILHPNNLEAEELLFRCRGFKVCTGARYLGGYIGDDESKGGCLKNSMEKWERDIYALSKTADKCPQQS